MSVITDDTPAEVEEYLAAVRATLSDLPPAERDDLLAEVESSLREAADDTGSIGARLGSPEEFATELRAAAGLHESRAATSHATIKETIERFVPRVAAARRVALELAPVWWAARGYVVVVGIAALAQSGWSTRYPVVPRFGNAEIGAAAILLASVASVVVGLRMRHAGGGSYRTVVAANALCVALAIPVVDHLGNSALQSTAYIATPTAYVQPGLVNNGAPVLNIYPYSLDGKLLHDVLLYDSAGKAIDIGGNPNVPNPDRRVLRTTGNGLLYNAFPIRYYEPGTVHVAHPNAGPPVKTPTALPAP